MIRLATKARPISPGKKDGEPSRGKTKAATPSRNKPFPRYTSRGFPQHISGLIPNSASPALANQNLIPRRGLGLTTRYIRSRDRLFLLWLAATLSTSGMIPGPLSSSAAASRAHRWLRKYADKCAPIMRERGVNKPRVAILISEVHPRWPVYYILFCKRQKNTRHSDIRGRNGALDTPSVCVCWLILTQLVNSALTLILDQCHYAAQESFALSLILWDK